MTHSDHQNAPNRILERSRGILVDVVSRVREGGKTFKNVVWPETHLLARRGGLKRGPGSVWAVVVWEKKECFNRG